MAYDEGQIRSAEGLVAFWSVKILELDETLRMLDRAGIGDGTVSVIRGKRLQLEQCRDQLLSLYTRGDAMKK